ncbi:MAG: efflux RND transporter periplasmic adaptor subunit [Bacteroidales bacterium]|nr:efflux RND transporter periplasmic adaptor subunit [Bacteroidales bacterium]
MVRLTLMEFTKPTVLLVLLVVGLWGCSPTRPVPPAPPPAKVTAIQPVVRRLADVGEYTGFVEAIQRVEIRPQIRGRLLKIHVPEGTEIKEGVLLYEIDPSAYQVVRNDAAAALDRAEADLKRAIAEEARSKASLDRLRKIAGTGGGVSMEELDQAIATHKIAVAAVGQASAAIDQAKAKLAAAELDLSYTKIYSPISGRVSRTQVTEGNLVGYIDATLLTVMVDQDPIYVYFDVPERDAIEYEARVKPLRTLAPLIGGLSWRPLWSDGMIPVEVSVETETDFPHKGVLNFREPRYESDTGTVRLRALLDNADRTLSSGMYARIRFPTSESRDRVMIAEECVLSDQQGRFVFVLKPDDTIEYRPVKVGTKDDGLIAIESGLSSEDWVVAEGIQKIRPKVKVAPDRLPNSSGRLPAPPSTPTTTK